MGLQCWKTIKCKRTRSVWHKNCLDQRYHHYRLGLVSKGQKAKTEELKEYKEDQQNFEFHPDNKCSWYNLFQVRNSFTISITFLSLKILRKKYRQSTTDKFAHAFKSQATD